MSRKKITPLKEEDIQKLKHSSKPQRVADGNGLFVYLPAQKPALTSGNKKQPKDDRKWFRFRFVWEKKQQEISLGVYGATVAGKTAEGCISLAMAREKAEKCRQQLKAETRPYGTVKKPPKAAEFIPKSETFGQIANAWFTHWQIGKDQDTIRTTTSRVKKHLYSRFAEKPFAEIDFADLESMAKAFKALGQDKRSGTLHKLLIILTQIGSHAEINDIYGADKYQKAVKKVKYNFPIVDSDNHYPALTDCHLLGECRRELVKVRNDFKKFEPITGFALQYSMLVFCRPGEIVKAKWADINFDKKIWRQPQQKIGSKKGRAICPLAWQTLALLKELHTITGHTEYLFPCNKDVKRHMPKNTMGQALIKLGYQGKQTAHGFRASAKTILSQSGFPEEWTEIQLGHSQKNRVVAAYSRGSHLKGRKVMMQWWADALDRMEKNEPLPPEPKFTFEY